MDFYSDQGALFVRIFQAGEKLPDFIKSASYGDASSLKSLPSSSFADSTLRNFPIHTPADVLVGASYFYGQGLNESMPDVTNSFKTAALVFGIEKELEEIQKVASDYQALQKSASAPVESGWLIDTNALTAEGEDFSSLQRFADDWMTKTASFSLDDRTEIAGALTSALRQADLPVPNRLRSLACEGEFDRDTLKTAFYQRGMGIHDSFQKAAFYANAETFGNSEAPTAEEMQKTAAYLDAFDRENNIVRLYGRGIMDPHTAVWCSFPEAQKTASIGGKEYPLTPKNEQDIRDAYLFVKGEELESFDKLASLTEDEGALVRSILS